MTSIVTKQFDKIFADHHDPDKKEQRKIIKRRKQRIINKKRDLGL